MKMRGSVICLWSGGGKESWKGSRIFKEWPATKLGLERIGGSLRGANHGLEVYTRIMLEKG